LALTTTSESNEYEYGADVKVLIGITQYKLAMTVADEPSQFVVSAVYVVGELGI
jgi:uncharacterized protein involved in high-affinity Fe2+ transport